MVRIRSARVVEGFTVRLTFTDGTEKTIDLRPYLCGPVFEPLLKDPDAFRALRVDQELGTIVWPNGADICPDVLYWDRKPDAWEP